MLRDPNNAAHLERAQQGARFVLIDEFQDSNVAQIELTRLLVADQANVFAVGDPDQAIYRFRGATAGAFDHFLKTFGTDRVKRVTMSENRRSTDVILKSAYTVISRNPEITSVELPGGERWQRAPLDHARTKPEPTPVLPVQVKAWEHADGEAAFVAQEIVRMHESGRSWRDFAVLYRSHSNRNALVKQLMQRDVPFTVEGIDLLETAEVRDLLSALRAIEGGDPVGLLRVAALSEVPRGRGSGPRGARCGRRRCRPRGRARQGCRRFRSNDRAGRGAPRQCSVCRARHWPRAASRKDISALRSR